MVNPSQLQPDFDGFLAGLNKEVLIFVKDETLELINALRWKVLYLVIH